MGRVLALSAVVLVSCVEVEEPPPVEQPSPAGCVPGEVALDDGSCLPAGIQANGCPAGELATDGGCAPAGIPPGGCGAGFEHDGERGCDPILPASCRSPLMAAPGEPDCHQIMSCGSGAWGDIPVDAETVYVDAAHVGPSDGTELAPFSTIGAAVTAAAPGALIAVAEGSYVEDVRIEGQAVRLRGRCPALVEVVGAGVEPAAITIRAADGTEVGGLAVTGGIDGIEVRASENVTLAELWIHDTALRGVSILGDEGATGFTLRSSLIESVSRLGVWVNGATGTIEETVIRDIAQDDGEFGDGIFADPDTATGEAPALVVRASLVERAHKVGIFGAGGQLSIDSTVVRDTLPGLDMPIGRGVQIQDGLGRRGELELQRSVIERSVNAGIVAYGSDALVAFTVIRDTHAGPDDKGGRGVEVDPSPMTGEPGVLTLSQSLVAASREVGVFVAGSQAEIAGAAVIDVQPVEGKTGEGIIVSASLEFGGGSSANIVGSLVEHVYEVGIAVTGSTATIDGTLIRDVQLSDYMGGGVDVEFADELGLPASAVIRSSVIESTYFFGIGLFGATATIEGTLVRNVAPLATDLYGDGVVASRFHVEAAALVRGSRIEAASRAGVASFGAAIDLQSTMLECHPIELAAQETGGVPSSYRDLGNNACGCSGVTEICRVLAPDIQAPSPLDPEVGPATP